MSELDAFFAKKDKKKKAAALKSARAAAMPHKPVEKPVAPPNGTPSATPQVDDGWIEFDDPRGSQVNTGGRTVVEMRRYVEEKETNNDGVTQTEKFSGWGARAEAAAEEAAAQGEDVDADPKPKDSVQTSSSAAFPSLADAAKVKMQKPAQPSEARPSSSSNPYVSANRPRFIHTNTEKLRQKLAEREAAMQK